ncbi:TPA: hypothetical protein N0F65_009266, partial [Lagenidium giganteum]
KPYIATTLFQRSSDAGTEAMNQDDFRRLLANSDGQGGSSRRRGIGGGRNGGEQESLDIRKLCAKKPKKNKNKKEGQAADDRPARSADVPVQPQYRDRAAERRQGLRGDMINADEFAHLDAEQTKYLGGDMEHTHLVKGLDFSLLAQLKHEKEKLMQAKAAALQQQETQAEQPAEKKTLEFKSRMARMVYHHSCQATQKERRKLQPPRSTASELFLPGRMYYTFKLTDEGFDSVPTIVQQSKEDWPETDTAIVSGMVSDLVISRVRDAVARRKLKKKQKQDNATAEAEESKANASVENENNTKLVADDSDDEDIFPDAGAYVPIGLREENEPAKPNTAVLAQGKGYFANLSASIAAAESAEKQREREAEEAWKTNLKTAMAAQARAEKEHEMKAKAKAAKLAEDEYSECFPEYQAAGAAYDSEDDEDKKRKKDAAADGDEKDNDTAAGHRKKQKRSNKLEADLQKITKRMDDKSAPLPAASSLMTGWMTDGATSWIAQKMADEIALARERLAAKFGDVRTGGKGTVRRKTKAVRRTATADDKKLGATLKKLGVTNIPGVEEVNLFKADGQVIHFVNPKVQASIASNTYAVSGHNQTKSLQELLPGIINQLGPDNLANLKQIAESYTAAQKNAKAAAAAEDDDDDVPDLVDNFEDVSKQD